MPDYLLIESRDPFENNSARKYYDLAAGLAKAGHKVTLYLVENGVLAAREGANDSGLADLPSKGVEILADPFSLKERAISEDSLADGVAVSGLEKVVDLLAEGRKALWH